MSRRSRGEGSIRLRADGRWEGMLALPAKAGKRQRRSVFGKTRPEVARKLREALAKVDRQQALPPENLTLRAHLTRWLAVKQTQLRPETYRRYDDYAKHIIPILGGVRLARLTIDDIEDLHKALAAKGLSATTVAHAHGMLHAALEDALRWDLVSRNVVSLVSAPRRSTKEMKFLSTADARDLLVAAKGHPLEALFVLALTAGLREGECQALRWKDIDLDRQRLRVVGTLTTVRKDGSPVIGEPKTQHSRRTVWLSGLAVDVLARHKATQDAARRLADGAWTEYGLVFTNGTGRPLWRSQVRRQWLDLLEKAGLPPMRVHDLRHSAATMLLEQGTPVKVVSEILGHSDVTTTLRIYAHVIEGAQEQATSVIDRLFNA